MEEGFELFYFDFFCRPATLHNLATIDKVLQHDTPPTHTFICKIINPILLAPAPWHFRFNLDLQPTSESNQHRPTTQLADMSAFATQPL
ncbi:hypothetical protein HPP92_027197 [Vanilla planifolia]|uniref:Uncharacterized protein n=1 Tax=Vanilla planifolia TaxID=51239 RepID=A0A835P9X8_VANPL|nr:hypothetical protein HPP92_027197 [Vanilla planifolia]